MCDKFSRDVIKVVIAKISKVIGWNSIHISTLEVFTDILQKYIKDLAVKTYRYSEHYGRTEPNLNDLKLAFNDMGINIKEFEEYISFVNSPKLEVNIPQYPINRESHLNLLRPGSNEVIMRPIHIHHHLPAMYPQLENSNINITKEIVSKSTCILQKNLYINSKFKPELVRLKIRDTLESIPKNNFIIKEIDQPLREIKSVLMTTSGYLSSGVEGKLPQTTISSRSASLSKNNNRSPLSENKHKKKSKKKYDVKINYSSKRDLFKEERRKRRKPNFKVSSNMKRKNNEQNDNKNVKKLPNMKELTKLSVFKTGNLKRKKKE